MGNVTALLQVWSLGSTFLYLSMQLKEDRQGRLPFLRSPWPVSIQRLARFEFLGTRGEIYAGKRKLREAHDRSTES